jgi:hypothetical protein
MISPDTSSPGDKTGTEESAESSESAEFDPTEPDTDEFFDITPFGSDEDPMDVRGEKPDVAEVMLGGIVPREEPNDGPIKSDDVYIRLEGKIYGPFTPENIDDLLQSGKLTGLEVASSDLQHWTPLAYHPRIVRGRIRDIDSTHDRLTSESTLPRARVTDDQFEDSQLGSPQAAIIRKPRPRSPEDDS